MYIESVPNRNSPPAILLRESFRVGKKTQKRTLANLTKWPPQLVETLRRSLKGEQLVSQKDAFNIVRSLPHGHILACLATIKKLKLDYLIASKSKPVRDLVLAMIIARIIDPRSKLATANALHSESASSSLASVLQIEETDSTELYEAMDWLLERQDHIEKQLAKRHLKDGSLVLYDVTSSYFEGRCCPLAAYGHNRDKKKGKRQIVFGLLTNKEGCPVAVEVFKGNTGDPSTVPNQIKKIQKRFNLKKVILVGDRGMITQARIDQDFKNPLTGKKLPGLEWITALKAPQIQELVKADSLQMSLFDEQDLAEIEHPSYPGERLIACRNPYLFEQRRRKRQELMEATEKLLNKIMKATQRKCKPLRGKAEIGVRVGKDINRHNVGKYYKLKIEEDIFFYERNEARIEQDALLDGIYVIRTSVETQSMNEEQVVEAYKNLSQVEQAFRSYKTVDLKVRPIYHRLEGRVRAHVFLCMLAYYVEWHMRKSLAPLLFDDERPQEGKAKRSSIVKPAERSDSALNKIKSKKNEAGQRVQSFQSLLKHLSTLTKNTIQPKIKEAPSFEQLSQPTPIQAEAFKLLGVRLGL